MEVLEMDKQFVKWYLEIVNQEYEGKSTKLMSALVGAGLV